MFRFIILLVVAIVLQGIATTTEKGNLVAFMCNKPARYLANGVWETDVKTDCLRRPKDILHYCRKVFPKVNVTNIMQALDNVDIVNWCQFDGQCESGHMNHNVQPYRCLSGKFQSDALLVPDHCFFDHIESDSEKSECFTYDKWNSTSRLACSRSGKHQQSFAPLRPCAVGKYAGVEFVCCPNKENKKSVKKELLTTGSTTETAPSSTDRSDSDDQNQKLTDHYLRHSGSRVNEHHYYLKARSALVSHHKFKVNKMMKEWAVARQRIHDIKETVPSRSDKLNEEITARFQKAYEALEEEGQAELEQLNVVHQQRVQVKLNNRKKNAMKKYMVALTRDEPNAHQITTTLKKYISIEQKDRMHTVRRMRHIQNADQPISRDAISALRRHSATHLRILSQRIEQSIEMLTRVPEFQDGIKKEIGVYMRSFNMVDNQVQKLLSKAAADDRRFANHLENKSQSTKKERKNNNINRVDGYKHSDHKHHNNKYDNIPRKVKKIDIEAKETDYPRNKVDEIENKIDSEVVEHEQADVHTLYKVNSVVSNVRSGSMNLQQVAYSEKSELKAGSPFMGTLGIIMFAVVAMVVIVIGSILLRKRNSPETNKSGGFLSVAQCSPDDRHINKMQANGYENPTYKYFEKIPSPSTTSGEPLIEKHPAAVVA